MARTPKGTYKAESSGIKGMRIVVHPSFYMNAGDLNDVLVPLPQSEQRQEAFGELNWYDVGQRQANGCSPPKHRLLRMTPSAYLIGN